jgi:hypothetical protein
MSSRNAGFKMEKSMEQQADALEQLEGGGRKNFFLDICPGYLLF